MGKYDLCESLSVPWLDRKMEARPRGNRDKAPSLTRR
jgi:hypothetical protein